MIGPSSVPAGNQYDKFNARNPVASFLVRNYKRHLKELVAPFHLGSVLEIGCGEGQILEYLNECGVAAVSGVDISSSVISKAKQRCPWTQLTIADGSRLPYADDSFDLVLACEALEHVMAPGEVLREAARVSKGHCVFSVPFEPLWRTLNMLRGAYVKNLGNTPGHVQHWTAGSFIRLLQDHFRGRRCPPASAVDHGPMRSGDAVTAATLSAPALQSSCVLGRLGSRCGPCRPAEE